MKKKPDTSPFWEDIYRNKEGESVYKDGNPSSDIVDVAAKLRSGSSVLDIGCGDGRNALYLARCGFRVIAFDISAAAIEKLNYLAQKAGLTIETFRQDMTFYDFPHSFDFIFTHGVLHLVTKAEWAELIVRIKTYTKTGGYNAHAVFTSEVEPPPDLKPYCIGLFDPDEIFDHYKDWTIELRQSYIFEDRHPGDIRHKHALNKIVARKPVQHGVIRSGL
jgi:tellurite methyltransferase